jgi:hypothetical protein
MLFLIVHSFVARYNQPPSAKKATCCGQGKQLFTRSSAAGAFSIGVRQSRGYDASGVSRLTCA